jgi:hypothetical protein
MAFAMLPEDLTALVPTGSAHASSSGSLDPGDQVLEVFMGALAEAKTSTSVDWPESPFDFGVVNRSDFGSHVLMWYGEGSAITFVHLFAGMSHLQMNTVDDIESKFVSFYSRDQFPVHMDNAEISTDDKKNITELRCVFITTPALHANVTPDDLPAHVVVLTTRSLMDSLPMLCTRPLFLTKAGPDYSTGATQSPLNIVYTTNGGGTMDLANETGFWTTWGERHFSMAQDLLENDGIKISMVSQPTPTGMLISIQSENMNAMPFMRVIRIMRRFDADEDHAFPGIPDVENEVFDGHTMFDPMRDETISLRRAVFRELITVFQANTIARNQDWQEKRKTDIPISFLLETGEEISAIEVYEAFADLGHVPYRSPDTLVEMGIVDEPSPSGDPEGHEWDIDEGWDTPFGSGVLDDDDDVVLEEEAAQDLSEALARLAKAGLTLDMVLDGETPPEKQGDNFVHFGELRAKSAPPFGDFVLHEGYSVDDLLEYIKDRTRSDPRFAPSSLFRAAGRAASLGLLPSKPTVAEEDDMRRTFAGRLTRAELSSVLGFEVTQGGEERARDLLVARLAQAGSNPEYNTQMSYYNLIVGVRDSVLGREHDRYLDSLRREIADEIIALTTLTGRMGGQTLYAATIAVKSQIHAHLARLLTACERPDDVIESVTILRATDHSTECWGDKATRAMRIEADRYKADLAKQVIRVVMAPPLSTEALVTQHRLQAERFAQMTFAENSSEEQVSVMAARSAFFFSLAVLFETHDLASTDAILSTLAEVATEDYIPPDADVASARRDELLYKQEEICSKIMDAVRVNAKSMQDIIAEHEAQARELAGKADDTADFPVLVWGPFQQAKTLVRLQALEKELDVIDELATRHKEFAARRKTGLQDEGEFIRGSNLGQDEDLKEDEGRVKRQRGIRRRSDSDSDSDSEFGGVGAST